MIESFFYHATDSLYLPADFVSSFIFYGLDCFFVLGNLCAQCFSTEAAGPSASLPTYSLSVYELILDSHWLKNVYDS